MSLEHAYNKNVETQRRLPHTKNYNVIWGLSPRIVSRLLQQTAHFFSLGNNQKITVRTTPTILAMLPISEKVISYRPPLGKTLPRGDTKTALTFLAKAGGWTTVFFNRQLPMDGEVKLESSWVSTQRIILLLS